MKSVIIAAVLCFVASTYAQAAGTPDSALPSALASTLESIGKSLQEIPVVGTLLSGLSELFFGNMPLETWLVDLI